MPATAAPFLILHTEFNNQKMPTKIQYENRTAGEILTEILAISEHPQEQGRRFEELFLNAAPRIPELEIKNIWRWADWPGVAKQDVLDKKDYGIDLVAETTNDTLVAIQCKCYTGKSTVDENQVNKFLAGAPKKKYHLRWFVATNQLPANTEKLLAEHEIRTIDFREHLDLKFDEQKKPVRQPWPLQQEAIDSVIQGFAGTGGDRGRLIMACGTGKTFTALRIAEQLAPGKANILFIAPSIALVAQTRREWLNHTSRKLACTVICSDRTAGSTEDINTTEISCEITTDPKKIAAALNTKIPADTARAVFCTYQSLKKLQDAQHNHGAPDFDLVLIDEAHRTTGYLDEQRSGEFQRIHKQENIRAAKRLYMTATPRVYQDKKGTKKNPDDQVRIVDMNDADVYGREFYRLGFKKAVENEMLCDYKVIALGITEDSMDDGLKNVLMKLNDDISGKGKAADAQAFLALGAIAFAINGIVRGKNAPGVLARTISFASNIRRSKWLAGALKKDELKRWVDTARQRANQSNANQSNGDAGIDINTIHLDGTSSTLKRNAALRELNNVATTQNPHLITNAQLFTEGVDVPALNAIAFLDPRQSKVDTIQAVGRVMRKDESSGKTTGYIIVPVILPPNEEFLDTLNTEQSRFKTLGNVLRALQSHDERLYTELTDRLTFATINRDYKPDPDRPPDTDYEPVQVSLLDEHARQEIYAQLATKVGIAQQGKIIADAITQAIEKAARLFKQGGATEVIAKTIGTPSDNEDESCKTAALLIANACIMHKRLEQTGNLKRLPPIVNANLVDDPASALMFAWIAILEKDYAPVFQDATALLKNLPKIKPIFEAIIELIQCATDNATDLNDLGFDHAGPLYHSVLGTAQSDGAYYTKNLSAYLLAGLAFDKNFTDWKDADKVRNLKVIDPACGTGTLLMAALNFIKKRATEAQNLDENGVNKLHKRLVENAIYGFDINKYSIQLAACNLTIGAPNTDYERMNMHTLQHGPIEGKTGDKLQDVRHGALEILLTENDKESFGKLAMPPPPLFGAGVQLKGISEVVMPEAFDVVIYNPPFTDTNKQGRRYSENTVRAMVERLQFIKNELERNDPKAVKAIATGSIGKYFTPLTNRLAKKANGVFGEIVPATGCTSENGKAERQYRANHFHIEMVVSSHDPKRINFSENTSIHECLVLGKRRTNNDQPTRFIQLVAYPNNVKEAETLIDAIHSGEAGELYSETLWPAEKMRAGDWTPVQWFNAGLVHAAEEINKLSSLIAIGDICVQDYREQGMRIFVDKSRSENGNAFCTINKDIMQTINSKPETKATPRPGYEAQADAKLFAKASCFLVALRFSTTSSRLLAIHSEQPAVGDGFVPMNVQNDEQGKAFALFLNSSFGAIQMLNRRTKKLTYPKYEKAHLKTLKLPDPNKADFAPLLAAFEQVKNTPLEKLANCATDPARKILDHAAAKSIGIDPAITDQWREWLSGEPTITNKPYQAS